MTQRPNKSQRETEKRVQASKTEEETSYYQQVEPIIILDDECDSNAFWPVGTESWHIHEIKPQRQVSIRSTFPDLLIMTQQLIIELQSEIPEKPSDFQTDSLFDEVVPQIGEVNDLPSQYIMKPSTDQYKLVEKNSQNDEKLLQRLPVVSLVKEQQQSYLETPKIRTVQCKLKLRHHRHDLLPVSNSPKRTSSHSRSHNSLLRLLGAWLVQWSLFLCPILLRIGITHNLVDSPGTFHNQLSTFNSEFIINTVSAKCPRDYCKNSLSFAKTIKILRDLESLLIYALKNYNLMTVAMNKKWKIT
jgi:hypothetical protein